MASALHGASGSLSLNIKAEDSCPMAVAQGLPVFVLVLIS